MLDFGLVKEVKRPTAGDPRLTVEGMTVGTPTYMAPEIALDEAFDGRADLYALGCVMYFLLTGKVVFESDNVMRLLVRHVEEKPVPPSRRTDQPIPRSLDDAVLACLAKDPAARPPSAAALSDALAAAEADVEPWSQEQAAAWWNSRARSKPREAAVVA